MSHDYIGPGLTSTWRWYEHQRECGGDKSTDDFLKFILEPQNTPDFQEEDGRVGHSGAQNHREPSPCYARNYFHYPNRTCCRASTLAMIWFRF